VKISNADKAFVDIRKLRDYSLNPAHRVGKHKARLFASLLGMKIDDAEEFRDLLLNIARTHDAEMQEKDEHGQRYRIDCIVSWHENQTLARSVWNVRPDEDFPRLITCYPIPEVHA
jgi:hypothetical protein